MLTLINAIYVPLEITFSLNSFGMELLNYFNDLIFAIDIFISFRTIYFDPLTGDPIADFKLIQKNYIYSGRFFIDLIATIPLEFITTIMGTRVS